MSKIAYKKPLKKDNHSAGYKIVFVSESLFEEDKRNQLAGKKPHPELVGMEKATDEEIKKFAPKIWEKLHGSFKSEPEVGSNAGKIFIDENIPTIASKKEDIEKYLTEKGVDIPEGSTKKSLLEIVESINQPPV